MSDKIMGQVNTARDGQNLSNFTIRELFGHEDHPLRISPYVILIPIVAYPLLCALLRKFRVRSALETFPYTTRRSYASMTQSDAYYIQRNISQLEFPFVFQKALQFALFRTYGIPSVSKLLVQTKQLSYAATSTKRYVDTVVLINDFAGFHPSSGRANEAMARMNFLHSSYIKSGGISNDDLLYTLSLFALEPGHWIDRWEWRQLEEFERCAIGTFWKGVGDGMNISYDKLKSGGSSGAGWIDGLQWLEEIEQWSQSYEKEAMKPHIDNFKTAEETTAILLWHVPTWAKAFGKKIIFVLMDDRLRTAMMYDKPSTPYFMLTHLLLNVRKYFLRYLSLPRIFRLHLTSEESSKQGNFFMTDYDAAPWYVKPTLWNRYGPSTWISRLNGVPLPGDEGDKYFPQGYQISQIGPDIFRGKGREFIEKERERLPRVRGAGCPFVRVKAE